MFIPRTCIDTLYDYTEILNDEPFCYIPEHEKGSEIAVVGAGAAGLLAAYELLRMGLKPTIYEASDRIGGRLYTQSFAQVDVSGKTYAELGAMRVPKNSTIFMHYAKRIGLECDRVFRGPGKVDTTIFYKNDLYHWLASQEPPSPFNHIKSLWEHFIEPIVHQVYEQWERGNYQEVRDLWQMYAQLYKDKSFYAVLRERSPFFRAEDLNIFGALGIGVGGFGPLFQVDFIEILRLVLNGYLREQISIPGGISQFIQGLYQLPVHTGSGAISLEKNSAIKLNEAVIQMDYNLKTQNPILISKNKENKVQAKEYRAIVFTGSMFAAQLMNLTNKTKSGIYLMDNNIRDAIRNSSLLAASKTFICTENKFWLNEKMPACILTDELPRAMYFLDYPDTKHGVICLSYTWGNDALKMHAVSPHDRLTIFKRVVEAISPAINKYIIPLNNEVLSIDWTNVKYQNGAFNLYSPGNDTRQQNLYFQFKTALSKETDKGVYLAGDGVSWSGGWVEGALYTAINAVFAVSQRLGAQVGTRSPFCQSRDF